MSERFELRDEMIVDVATGECFEVEEIDGRILENINNMDSLIKSLIGKCVENGIDIQSEIAIWGPEYDEEAGLNLNDWVE